MANIIEVDDLHAPGTSVFCGMRDGALRKAGGSDGGVLSAHLTRGAFLFHFLPQKSI